MEKIALKILSLVIITATITSGCKQTMPQALIKAPEVVKVSTQVNTAENMKATAQKFIPEGYKLLDEDKVVNKKQIVEIDLDNDKVNELVVFIKNDEKYEKGFLVIKKIDNKWTKVYEKIQEANSISKVDTVNIYNNDKKSLLVGFFISGHGGTEYYAYTFNNGKLAEEFIGNYNKFEILNTPDKDSSKGFVFAAWVDRMSNIQEPEVIGFDGKRFFPVDDLYKEYYEKNVVKYYEDIIKEKGENLQYAWEKLSDAQIKAGKNEEALKSIDKALEIKKKSNVLPVEEYKFNYLKGVALNNLENYKEAEDILVKVEKDILKQIKVDSVDKDDKNFDLSKVYFELGKIYASEKKESNAKEMFNKSLVILKDLSNKDYFFKRDFYNYPVQKELSKLTSKGI